MRTSYALAALVECIRKRKEWDVYELIVDLLANEEVDVLEAKEERNFR
jgi:3-dehydroquinate dehydratase